MRLRSFWTKEAVVVYTDLLNYLEKEWGPKVASAFLADVAHTIDLLEVFPNGGILELKLEDVRSIPVA